MTKLSINKVKKAIEGSKGVVATIQRKCEVSYVAMWAFLKKNPELNELILLEREKVIDLAEDAIYNIATMDYDPQTLNTKLKAAEKIVSSIGAKRGWATKQEIETSNELKKINPDLMKLEGLTPEQEKTIREAMYGNI